MTRDEADAIAERTQDAYSFHSYGERGWRECCRMLARRGYDARQVEAIMRSKWTRWAADSRRRKLATSGDLERFLDGPRNAITLAEVVKLTEETFAEAR